MNKGNTLAILGRFGEALQCYDTAVREGNSSPGVVSNRNAMAEILNIIDNVKPEIQIEINHDELPILHLLVPKDNLTTKAFAFQGNIGNTGNFGYNLPEGRGFGGKTGFAVIVSENRVNPEVNLEFDWLETNDRLRWFCVIVMPDHIHAVIQLSSKQTLSRLIQSFKSHTANRLMRAWDVAVRFGNLLTHDHGIRRDESLKAIIEYCYQNPVRSGLVKAARDYPFWRCKFEME